MANPIIGSLVGAPAARFRRGFSLAVLVSTIVLALAGPTLAQQPTAKPKTPEPKDIAPATRDGVQLSATYYAPAKPGKDVVPVILLHGHRGSRADFHALAVKLQEAGHAVIAPDLRGHGRSTRQALPGGRTRDIDSGHLVKQDVANMAQFDVEACKSYLMDRNNAGELNIDKLCVIGADLGAVIAANWAMLDWSWPPLATGKQGQDVKAVVLLSPPKTFRGLTIMPAINNRDVASRLSWLVVYGDQSNSELRDGKSIAGQLEKWLPMPPPEDVREKQAMFHMPVETNLQGAKLTTEANLRVTPSILKFIELRLVKQPYPWANRQTLP